jgi:DNA-binding ferritin-like protein
MENLKVSLPFTTQTVHTTMHRTLIQVRQCHVKTRNYPAHEAFDKIYEGVSNLIDDITEQLIGYSGEEMGDLVLDTVRTLEPAALASQIIEDAAKIIDFANKNKYYNIENLAQEFSGLGAKLKYLSRF